MQIARYYLGFYYDQLDIDQQVLYRRVAKAVAHYEDSFPLRRFQAVSLRKVLVAVKYDNPEFAYWNMTDSKEEEGQLCLKYLTKDVQQALDLVGQMREKRCQVIQLIHTSEELFTYLTEQVEYADAELERPTDHPWINEACGPLLKGRGVCLGTALALKYLMDGAGMDSFLITGKANVAGCYCNHAWNMVCSEKTFYHADVTEKLWVKAGENNEEIKNRTWSKVLYPAA